MARKMTSKGVRRPYEGSKKDVAEDTRQARQHGMTMKEWEASPMDRAQDKAASRAMRKRK